MLPKTSAYVKSYDVQTKQIDFLIEDDDLLEKNNAIWDKVSADIERINSKPRIQQRVYNRIFFENQSKIS